MKIKSQKEKYMIAKPKSLSSNKNARHPGDENEGRADMIFRSANGGTSNGTNDADIWKVSKDLDVS